MKAMPANEIDWQPGDRGVLRYNADCLPVQKFEGQEFIVTASPAFPDAYTSRTIRVEFEGPLGHDWLLHDSLVVKL